jgi:hypothetical protein
MRRFLSDYLAARNLRCARHWSLAARHWSLAARSGFTMIGFPHYAIGV